jgi:hypothetical protein
VVAGVLFVLCVNNKNQEEQITTTNVDLQEKVLL